MENTIQEYSKLLYVGADFKGIKSGDIVSILTLGDGEPVNLIKRVIALSNETIQIQGEKVCINYELLEEPYAYYSDSSDDFIALSLGENEYFVIEDNRLSSSDSREPGPVPKEYILSVLI